MSGALRIGELNRQIKLQQRASSQDTYGQQVNTWSDVCTTWAHIRPLSGRELIAAQAVQSEVSHEIVIRYRPGITAAMRAVYQGRFFNILAVLDQDTQHRSLVLQVSEGLNQG